MPLEKDYISKSAIIAITGELIDNIKMQKTWFNRLGTPFIQWKLLLQLLVF